LTAQRQDLVQDIGFVGASAASLSVSSPASILWISISASNCCDWSSKKFG